MYDAGCVGGSDSGQKGRKDRDDLVVAERAPFESLAQRLPRHHLHHEVRRPGKTQSKVVDRDDVGVSQLGHQLRFALEALHRLVVLAQLAVENFDRHFATELLVESRVDRAHGSRSQDAVKSVLAAQDGTWPHAGRSDGWF